MTGHTRNATSEGIDMLKFPTVLPFLVVAMLFSGTSIFTQTNGSQTPMPGSLGEKKSAHFIVTLSSDPTPPVRGLGTLEAIVTDAAGASITDAQVTFDLNMTNMNHGKNIVTAVHQGKGAYGGKVRFMMPGPWRAIVRVLRPGQEPEDLRFEFNVKFR